MQQYSSSDKVYFAGATFSKEVDKKTGATFSDIATTKNTGQHFQEKLDFDAP